VGCVYAYGLVAFVMGMQQEECYFAIQVASLRYTKKVLYKPIMKS